MMQSLSFALHFLMLQSMQEQPRVPESVTPLPSGIGSIQNATITPEIGSIQNTTMTPEIGSIQNVTVSFVDTGLLVTWIQPVFEELISGYQLEWICGGNGSVVVNPSVTDYTIETLSPFTPCSVFISPIDDQNEIDPKWKTEITIDCHDNFALIRDMCYYSPSENRTMIWTDAKQYCEDLNSTLAVFNVNDDDLLQEIIDYSPQKWAWIGAFLDNNLNEWVWLNGSIHQGSINTTNYGGECVEINRDGADGNVVRSYYCNEYEYNTPLCQSSVLFI